MKEERIKVKSAQEAIGNIVKTMTANITGDKVDVNQGLMMNPGNHYKAVADGTDYRYYPWGNNNRKPVELLSLLRSNADMMNLLKTRVDFLYGGGVMLYEKKVDGSDLLLIPQVSTVLDDWMLEKDVNGLADGFYTNSVELANAHINVDVDKKKEITLRDFDSSTVRSVITEKPNDFKYLVSAKWDSAGGKKAQVFSGFPGLTEVKPGSDYLIHVKPKQPGQFYYGFPSWSALEAVIRLANKIPKFHTDAIDTEGNLGYVIHIARKYFKDLAGKYENAETGEPFTEDELIEEFDKEIDDFLLGGGKVKTLRDVCEMNPATNEIQKLLEIEAIKKANTGKEYIELASYTKRVMTDGGQVQGGLAGMSDNNMNSGGGTEIRIGAEYQQFYRTPRERQQFLRILNMIYLPILREKKLIGDNVVFQHQNILLQTLDKNKSGAKDVPGVSQ